MAESVTATASIATLSNVLDDDRGGITPTYAILSGDTTKFALDGSTTNQINLIADIVPDRPDMDAFM